MNVRNLFYFFLLSITGKEPFVLLFCAFGYSKISQSLLTLEGANVAGAMYFGNVATAMDWMLDLKQTEKEKKQKKPTNNSYHL